METVLIDFGPLVVVGIEVLAGLLLAVGSWGAYKLTQYLDLKNEEQLRNVVMSAIERGVNYGKNKALEEVKDADWAEYETKNKLVGHAAQYVLTKVPNAVKKFKLTEDQIKDLVLAKLDVPASTPKLPSPDKEV